MACLFLFFPEHSPGTGNPDAAADVQEQDFNNLYPDKNKELTTIGLTPFLFSG